MIRFRLIARENLLLSGHLAETWWDEDRKSLRYVSISHFFVNLTCEIVHQIADLFRSTRCHVDWRRALIFFHLFYLLLYLIYLEILFSSLRALHLFDKILFIFSGMDLEFTYLF